MNVHPKIKLLADYEKPFFAMMPALDGKMNPVCDDKDDVIFWPSESNLRESMRIAFSSFEYVIFDLRKGSAVMEPDTYRCPGCGKEVLPEQCSHTDAGMFICHVCRENFRDTFYCEGECNKAFKADGIPNRCPDCGSRNVKHLYSDTNKLIADHHAVLDAQH